MTKQRPERWAIVQHSGYGYNHKSGFKQGLELRQVSEKKAEAIKAIGGKVFNTYREADDYCMTEMYPPEVGGLYPRAPGAFSRHKVDGLAIYLPKS